MIIFGPLLAPLAFAKMPVTVSTEIAQYAHSYEEILFTLFFARYFHIVTVAFFIDDSFGTILYPSAMETGPHCCNPL